MTANLAGRRRQEDETATAILDLAWTRKSARKQLFDNIAADY